MEKKYVNICVCLEDVDIILNALEEKVLNIRRLKQEIFDSVSSQVNIKKDDNNKKGNNYGKKHKM